MALLATTISPVLPPVEAMQPAWYDRVEYDRRDDPFIALPEELLMNARSAWMCWLVSVMVFAGGSVCTAEPPADKTPVVPVAHPVERMVTDFKDFTGRTHAVDQVELRARVFGFLVKTAFKDGADVKKGDLLFELDPRPYQARLDQALSQVALQEASLKLAKVTYARDQAIIAKAPDAISKQQLDQDQAAVDEAAARLMAAKASTEIYKLDLAYTKIVAPINGHIGQCLVTPGNLVMADTTLLATIVTEDPIYVYFDMDERTLLQLRQSMNEGKIKAATELPVMMGLAGEDGFPRRGTLNFTDNRVDPDKGTIRLRAVFPNPKPPQGVRLMVPGMSVRSRLLIGGPYKALLVRDQSVAADQGLHYVYVIDADNKVQHRRITTGELQDDGMRVVLTGLKPDDLVVVDRQGLRPKITVQPEKVK
jgi:multidrug efflux system membrane fusion protein